VTVIHLIDGVGDAAVPLAVVVAFVCGTAALTHPVLCLLEILMPIRSTRRRPQGREARVRVLSQVTGLLATQPHLPMPAAIQPDPGGDAPVRVLLPMLSTGSPRLLVAWAEALRRVEKVTATALDAGLAEVTVHGKIGSRRHVEVRTRVRLDTGEVAAVSLQSLRDWSAPAGPGPAARVMAAMSSAATRAAIRAGVQ
jgi:hypothetical protein